MGRIFVVDLEGRSYRCKFCKTQLALADDLISRAFHCRRGKAYLFNNVTIGPEFPKCAYESVDVRVNVIFGAQEERMMISGMHTVADVFCCSCGQLLGWKYETAHEESQKYKQGKFALERDGIVDGADSEFYIAFL